jgi:hypothetical protein
MTQRTEYQYDKETGIFVVEKPNYFAPVELENEYQCLPWCILTKPNPPEGKVAVINSTKTGWNYKDDKSGDWYKKSDRSKLVLKKTDWDFNVADYTRKIPLENSLFCTWNGSDWILDKDTKEKESANGQIKNQLTALDFQSIRALREWLGAQSDAPKFILEYEEKAKELRGQLL